MHSGGSVIVAILLFSFQEALSFLPPGLPSVALAGSRHQCSTKVTMAANDQLPADAKRYYVRSDRLLDIVTSAPQLLLRLGSGALVDGYRCECLYLAQQTRVPIFHTIVCYVPGAEFLEYCFNLNFPTYNSCWPSW